MSQISICFASKKMVLTLYILMGGIWPQNLRDTPPTYPPKKTIHLASRQVNRIAWWMSMYGAKTPKRQYAWSNSTGIRRLDVGWRRMRAQVQTVRHYFNSEGRRCWHGTRHLRETQNFGSIQSWKFDKICIFSYSFNLIISYQLFLYDIYYEEIPKHNHGFRYLVNWLINGYYIISMGRVNFNLFGFRLQLPTLAGLIRSLLPSAL